MAAADLRVSLEPILRAFGVSAVVTPTGGAPVATRVVWLAPGGASPDAALYPAELSVRSRGSEPRVLVFAKKDVPVLPRLTLVSAPEVAGGTVREWRVDSADYADADHHRAYVVPAEA